MIAIIPYNWTRRQLILLSGMRTCLIPLLLLCCAPRHNPVIAGEAAAFVFSSALGVTNGLAGSLPMMLAPAKVPATLKEVTGNMMTLSYNVGLTAGSLIGYVFESMLGPQLMDPCPSYPYIAAPNNNSSLLTTPSTRTTMLTTLAESTISSAPTFAAFTSTTAAAASSLLPTLLTIAASSSEALATSMATTTGRTIYTTELPPEAATTTRVLATILANVTEFVVANVTMTSLAPHEG